MSAAPTSIRGNQAFPTQTGLLDAGSLGLSIRQYAAIACAHGILANPNSGRDDDPPDYPTAVANASVRFADALIRELEKTP